MAIEDDEERQKWPTRAHVARRLKTSRSQVKRFEADGTLNGEQVVNAAGVAVTRFDPEEVEALASEAETEQQPPSEVIKLLAGHNSELQKQLLHFMVEFRHLTDSVAKAWQHKSEADQRLADALRQEIERRDADRLKLYELLEENLSMAHERDRELERDRSRELRINEAMQMAMPVFNRLAEQLLDSSKFSKALRTLETPALVAFAEANDMVPPAMRDVLMRELERRQTKTPQQPTPTNGVDTNAADSTERQN